MDKQNVVYKYNGTLFSLKLDRNLNTWMHLEEIMLSEISQPQKDKHCMIPSYEVPRVVKFRDRE